MLALLQDVDMPVAFKTMAASGAAASFRIFLMPVDAMKTIMQVCCFGCHAGVGNIACCACLSQSPGADCLPDGVLRLQESNLALLVTMQTAMQAGWCACSLCVARLMSRRNLLFNACRWRARAGSPN